jgi:hypothetical protein
MLKSLKHVLKGKLIIAVGVLGLATVVGLTLTPTSNVNAATRECHVFTPSIDWYEGGFFTSNPYTVPSSSQCLDINVT